MAPTHYLHLKCAIVHNRCDRGRETDGHEQSPQKKRATNTKKQQRLYDNVRATDNYSNRVDNKGYEKAISWILVASER